MGMAEQLGLLMPTPTAEAIAMPAPPSADKLSYSLSRQPSRLLPVGVAMNGIWADVSGIIAEVTLWCNPTLAPIPAPPEQSNTWVVSVDGQPIHDRGLPHRRDALQLLADYLGDRHDTTITD